MSASRSNHLHTLHLLFYVAFIEKSLGNNNFAVLLCSHLEILKIVKFMIVSATRTWATSNNSLFTEVFMSDSEFGLNDKISSVSTCQNESKLMTNLYKGDEPETSH